MLEIFSRIALSCVLIILISDTSVDCAMADDVDRLFKDKLNNANPKLRPVLNQTEVLDVEFTLYLVAMTDLNEVKQKVEATVWMEVHWENELVRWNASDYGDLDVVYPKPETMWRPDLAVTNGYNELNPVGLDFVIMKVASSGHTVWYPGQKIEFLCKIDVSQFPFDTQNCFLEFFNWASPMTATTLKYRHSQMESTEAMHTNSEWSIVGRRVESQIKHHQHFVKVHLQLKRKSLSLVLTVLLPVFLLSFLSVFVFMLPAESGEKLSFGLTVLLSQAVFLSVISGLMPQTSDTISGLSIYISFQLVLSTLYVLLTCCFIRLYHRDTSERPLPCWCLQLLCFNGRNTVHPFNDDGDKKKIAFDACGPSGIEISKRLDKVCFGIFFLVVISMTSMYLVKGIFL